MGRINDLIIRKRDNLKMNETLMICYLLDVKSNFSIFK